MAGLLLRKTIDPFNGVVLLLLVLLVTTSVTSADVRVEHLVLPSQGQSCPQHRHCQKLSYYLPQAINYFISDTDLLFLEGDHYLDRDTAVEIRGEGSLRLIGEGQWRVGPEELVMQSSVVIHCNKTGSGLMFADFSLVVIQGLTFVGCGAYFPSQNIPHKLFFAGTLFLNISNLTIYQTSVQHSIGYGLATIDCTIVNVTNSSFAWSNVKQLSSLNMTCYENITGGNSAFFYQSPATKEYQLTLNYSNFTEGCGGGVFVFSNNSIGNATVHTRMDNTVLNKNFNEQSLRFVLKGGIICATIVNSVIKDGHTYQNNSKGAGIYLRNHQNTKFVFTLQRTVLQNNIGGIGGVIFFLCSGKCSFYMFDTIIENHSLQPRYIQETSAVRFMLHSDQFKELFVQNLTMSLGGVYHHGFRVFLLYDYSKHQSSHFMFIGCNFTGNKEMFAILSFNPHANNVNLTIVNSTFQHNSGIAAIVAVNVASLEIHNITISDNNMTAIMLDNTLLISTGYNVIQCNTNIKGTGVQMASNSAIRINGNSTLVFCNNTAKSVGGAILVQQVLPRPVFLTICSIMPGFFTATQQQTHGKIVFNGNHAEQGGSDTYGLNLINCECRDERKIEKMIQAVGNKNDTSYYFNISTLENYIDFQFYNFNKLSSMSSEPIMVCFCDNFNNNLLPNCTNRTHPYVSIYPGQEVDVTIATVGYYGGTSFGTVLIDVENLTLISPQQLQATTANCSKLSLALYNPLLPANGLVHLNVTGGLPDWQLSLFVNINECPPGFEIISEKCSCAQFLHSYNISCNISAHLPFNRSGNNWFAYLNNSQLTAFNFSHCLTAFDNCPFDYCNKSIVSFDIQQPNQQCAGNRTGILCGQCQLGLSLLLGSNQCASCSNMYLLMLLVFLVAGVVLVAVLMILNLTVSIGTVNGLLLYVHMVKLNEPFIFINGPIPVLSQFIAWLNLDLGIEVCFFDGLDGYWKSWLQFVFPGYLFLLMGAIIIGCRYSVRLSRLCGSNAVPALATLFLMSYTKTLQTVTNTLAMSWIVCDNGSMFRVWSVDGNIPYLSGKHVLLLVFSCSVLLLGVVYPVLVLFAPLLEKYGDKCFPVQWNPVANLKPLLDAYGGPYRDTYRFWTGVTLLLRLIITVSFSFTSGDLISLNCHIISLVVLGILSVWSLTRGVYRKARMNILEVLYLVNLFLLTNATLASFYLGSCYYHQTAVITSVSFSMLLFCICCIIHALWVYKRFHRDGSTDMLVHHNMRSPAGSSPSRVYGTERGQHQFDLTFEKLDDNTLSSAVLREREPLLFNS